MRRLEVVYRQEALRDLENIYLTIADVSQNHAVARRFVHRIEDRCERIGNVPRGGRPRNDLEAGLRTVPFEHSAIIAYRISDNRVAITNIFYGGRDYEAFYLGSVEGDAEPETEK